MISAALREKIKELMVDFGYNQTQLSKKTGIGVSTISNLLRGPRFLQEGKKPPNVKLSTLEAIAKALGCQVHIDFIDAEWTCVCVGPVEKTGWL